ncbi:TPA: hypothetical protein N0F65_005293 [Lagenidium giganteum]|uniref:NADH dehydrogenase subunit 6 n=1 Tax=Lagenidium giganteum TaxID=4803 RepID=A0AAV2YYC6_9STRA|nr:TPA: hypothetical protein N0F65_005293 [Lagenidium giganteum]
MCVIRDECVLLAMLVVQLVCGLPIMALMKMVGVAYLLIFGAAFFVSLCLTVATRMRCRCCRAFATFINEYGICFFLVLHLALLTLATYTLYMFLVPFFRATDFEKFCEDHKLSDNLSHTGCERLQGFYALSLVSLTIATMATLYQLLLGSRITHKNWNDSAGLLKDPGMA